jgi:hypothetical protein
LAEGNSVNLSFGQDARAGKIRVEVNEFADNLDLRADMPGKETFSFSSASPYGQYTSIPDYSPGSCVFTVLRAQGHGTNVEVNYNYMHQEGIPEESSKVRFYAEDRAGRWRLADTITFLGPKGVPVRLDEFRRANSDTVAEYARIAQTGDARTYEQWLADHLTAYTDEWSRTGIVQESRPRAVAESKQNLATVSRHVPLPAQEAVRWQVSVTPGTRTKSGPEYFGIPFSANAVRPGSLEPISVGFVPPDFAPDAPLPFGRIKLRLRFPPNRWSQSEPLVSTGVEEAGDFVYAYYYDKDHIRFGFDHWFVGGEITPPIPIDFTKEHTLEISIGSLFPSSQAVVFSDISPAGVSSVKNRVLIILNGQTVMDTEGVCYETSSDTVTIGRNAIKGTLCGPLFTGKILSVERVWPALPKASSTPAKP